MTGEAACTPTQPLRFRASLRSGYGLILGILVLGLAGCGAVERRQIETTAYCGCGECCDWTRGSWKYLKLNFWVRYVDAGSSRGRVYTGKTASGTSPRQYYPGLFSVSSITKPWLLPLRIIFPWRWLERYGTIAADTRHYPFGTEMYVPGYGWGVVEDRGGAIKGPTRIDLFYEDHDDALHWGRKTVVVEIHMK